MNRQGVTRKDGLKQQANAPEQQKDRNQEEKTLQPPMAGSPCEQETGGTGDSEEGKSCWTMSGAKL
jgi:hypothetical protein